jgi:type 1 fimbria pilin
MANFKFQKSASTIAFSAALTLLSVATQAQSANDSGELLITGQISNTTCVLSLGDDASTGAGKKTMALGNFKATDYTAANSNTTIGSLQSTVLSLKNADGTKCSAGAGNSLWDVGIFINSSNYTTLSEGNTLLLSTAASGTAATGVGVRLLTAKGATVKEGTTAVNFALGNTTYGTLLAGSAASGPAVAFTESIAVSAQMVKTAASGTAPGVGAFVHSVPLNVWYK